MYDAYGNYIGNDPVLLEIEEKYKPNKNIIDGEDFSISEEEKEIVSDTMPRFEKDISYTPTTVLKDRDAMSVIRKYMEDFEGILEGDMSDEELVEDYLVRMRKFSAGQSVVTGGEVLQELSLLIQQLLQVLELEDYMQEQVQNQQQQLLKKLQWMQLKKA